MTAFNPLNSLDNKGHRARVQKRFLDTPDSSYLQDYEFLELILMKAIPRRDVKPLAKTLLYHFGSLSKVLKAESEELRQFKGVSDSTIALFKIILEANQRILDSHLKENPVLDSWTKVIDYCCLCLQDDRIERFMVLYLNKQLRLIRREIPQTGTKDRVCLYPDEVLRRALLLGASHVIIAHNHPSGNTEPSLADFNMTAELFKALTANGIKLIDHLIIGSGHKTYSFSAHGRISANPRMLVKEL